MTSFAIFNNININNKFHSFRNLPRIILLLPMRALNHRKSIVFDCETQMYNYIKCAYKY